MTICLVALAVSQQAVSVAYEQFGGLQVKVHGIPLIRGSSFAYNDPKTGRNLYASRWSPKTVGRLPDGTLQIRFNGDNGNAIGTFDIKPSPEGFSARYQFRWRGDGSVEVENVFGLLAAPLLSHGAAYCDGARNTAMINPVDGSWNERTLLGPGKEFRFEANVADVEFSLRGGNASLVDARGLDQDWARPACLFWLGKRGMRVAQGDTLDMALDCKIRPAPWSTPVRSTLGLAPSKLPVAIDAVDGPAPAVPKPKSVVRADGACALLERGQGTAPGRLFELLKKRWELDGFRLRDVLTIRTDPSRTRPQGYVLTVSPERVEIVAHDPAGRGAGLATLARLAEARQGTVVAPCCTVEDWPTVPWRGVHFFAGPDESFQKRVAQDFWAPLAFNHAVIECERTQWDVLPASESKGWATKAQLRGLFKAVEEEGLEPVPLIQSLGHMDWLLSGKHKGLAVNPDIPYTLDSRKSEARNLVKQVWTEAVALLQPRTLHFGLDEASMRGMPDDPTLATRLWQGQLPTLVGTARSARASVALWGDMLLAPGQAPDATHAPSEEQAIQRRAAVPAQATVFDWHYLATPDPSKFKSLPRWKDWGYKPVAASWYRAGNVRAHTMAAVQAGAGTLQATWAGYRLDEASVVANPDQFAAHVLAADYAWSGRTDLPKDLGYQPMAVLRDALWPWPSPLHDLPGAAWLPVGHPKAPFSIGRVRFESMPVASLHSPLTGQGSLGASSLVLPVTGKVAGLALAVDCLGWEGDGTGVAVVTVEHEDGTVENKGLRYGADVRAPEDPRPCVAVQREAGLSCIWMAVSPTSPVKQVTISATSDTAGLRVRAVTTW